MKFKKNDNSIGLVCTSIDNMAGGLERQILRTCECFVSKGFKVYLFTFDNNDAVPFYKLPNGVQWIKCGQNLIPHQSAPLKLRLKQIFYLRKKIRQSSIASLITFHHGLFPRSLLACLFFPIKMIISERNSLNFYKYIKLSKFNIGFISLFFANLITVQVSGYKNQYPFLLRKRIFVIGNFIKKPLDKYLKPNIESNRVAMIGRICAQKNFELILHQLNYKGHNANILLNIAGEGDLMNKYKIGYAQLIKNSKLSLHGNVKDIDTFLSNSAIYCMNSLWEGYPNSLAEALRMCLPIVISKRFDGLKNFVEHGVNGLIVNDEFFLDNILELLNNKQLLLKMSYESYKKYLKLYKSKPSKDWYDLIKRKN